MFLMAFEHELLIRRGRSWRDICMNLRVLRVELILLLLFRLHAVFVYFLILPRSCCNLTSESKLFFQFLNKRWSSFCTLPRGTFFHSWHISNLVCLIHRVCISHGLLKCILWGQRAFEVILFLTLWTTLINLWTLSLLNRMQVALSQNSIRLFIALDRSCKWLSFFIMIDLKSVNLITIIIDYSNLRSFRLFMVASELLLQRIIVIAGLMTTRWKFSARLHKSGRVFFFGLNSWKSLSDVYIWIQINSTAGFKLTYFGAR